MHLRLPLLLALAALLTSTAAAFNFTISKLNGVGLPTATTLQFGPDNRLYVAQVDGQIKALTIQRTAPNNYQVTATETINLVRDIPNYNDDGTPNAALTTRQVTGLLVVGTAANPILYVSSSDPRIGGGSGGENDLNLDTNSGIISRLTKSGGTWTKVDLVRGLPRSEENHATNGMQLDSATNTLYVAQGGNSNAGGPSVNFAYMCETALSAAILSVDLDAINALPLKTDGYGQKYLYDLPTLDDPNPARGHNPDGTNVRDPFGGNDGLNQARLVPGGPVQVYAPGFRNPYDLLITRTAGREGRMYTFDNGANAGWGGYPKNEGPAGNVTNEYVDGEPGYVNNKDNLHLITGPGYYGGHPNPVRANPAGAGWFHYDNTLPAGSEKVFSFTPTSDWPPVPLASANPVEGDFRQPGPENGALLLNNASTNGLCEYVATNFSGGMQGNLIAASYDGKLLRIALSPDGQTVTNGLEVLANGFGALPLDVTAPDPGHGAPFLGTIWVAHYSPGKISILEPEDFDSPGSSTCTGINSFDVDEDHDGYSNADEIANHSDPCSSAIRPPDNDADNVSDLLDADDDNDGVPDTADPFPIDPTNGRSVPARVHYEFFNDTGFGFFGVGMTGLMMNRGEDYLQRISDDNIVAGGTAGLFTISQAGPGTPEGSANSLTDAYQFAYNSDEFTAPFVVTSRLAGPFFGHAPTGGQRMGVYLGYGDQDNYIAVALHANDGAGGLQVVNEVAGTVLSQSIYTLPGSIADLSTIDLAFTVDPVAGTVQPAYRIADADPLTPLGPPLHATGDVLMAIMGRYPLAIGLFASTGSSATPTFSATWDWIDVAPQPSSAIAKITIDPPGSNMVTASTYNAGSFKVQNLSTGGQQIQSVVFDLRTSIFQDMVFDITGTAGDEVAKAVHPDSASSGVSFQSVTMAPPHNGTDGDDGYDGAELDFNAFPSGGSFTFSVDIDPNNVKGVAQPGEHDAASVSGLELAGGTATIYFSDGSVQRTRFGAVENSVDAAFGWARSDKPPKPGIGIVGQATPFTTGQAQQTIRVSGPAGLAVMLNVIEAGQYLAGVPGGGYNLHPYEANTAVAVSDLDATIGANGYVDIPITLTRTDPKAGYFYLTATLADANGITGPASDNLVVRYDPSLGNNDTQPPTAPGPLSFSNIGANTLTVNWTAATDNVAVTGYRISRNGLVLTTVTGTSFTDSGLAANTTYAYTVIALDAAGNTSSPSNGSAKTAISNVPTPIRINVGGGAYTDTAGNTWSADTGYNTGNASSNTATVSGTAEPTLFQTDRYDAPASPELAYTLSLANGSYTVRLYFAETYAANKAAGKRVFDVNIQGQLAFNDVDIFTQAGGGDRALVLQTPVTVANNQLTIQFIHQVENPKINAIEILPASSGTDTQPPSTPTNLAASDVTTSSLTLTWTAATDDVGVTGYRISRDGSVLTTVTATSFSDTGLSADTAYAYSVVALDAAGNASTAATLNVTTAAAPTDTQPPSAPTNLAASNVTASSLTLTWIAATDNVGVTGYRVSRDGSVLTTVTSTSFSDSGLTANTAYAYSVVALDAAGNASTAATLNVTTAAASTGTTLRLNAGGPSYVDGAGHTWAADTGYNTGSTYTSTATVAGTADPTLFKTERYDAPASPELSYTFNLPNGNYTVRLYFAEAYGPNQATGKRVFDVNVQGQLAFHDVDIFTQAGGANQALVLATAASVTNGQLVVQFVHQVENPKVNAIEILPASGSADTTAPTTPGSLAASNVTTTSATLAWTASTDDVGVTGYRISRDGAVLTTLTGTTYTDSGLTPATTYAYAVVALDAAGNASAPASLNVTTADASDTQPPTAPGSLTFSNVTSSALTVSWTAASDNVGVTGYRISRDGAVLATVTSPSYADSGLSPATTYAYSVVALDTAGNVSAASTASIATASAGGSGTAVRLNAGGPAYVDTAGNTWSADTGYNTGKASTEPGTVSGTSDPTLFKTVRFDESPSPELTYTFAVPNGSYSVRLLFAETAGSGNGVGQRVFHIDLQGQRAFSDVDIFAQAGGSFKALVLQKDTAVTNGQLTVTFLHKVNNPRVSAIEIVATGGSSADTEPPTAPADLAASNVTASNLTLGWTAATDNVGVTAYRVSRDGTLIDTVTGTSFTDSGLSPSTTYSYAVVALDAAGNSSPAATLDVATPAAADTQPPTQPGSLTFSNVTASTITVNWTAASDNVGVTGYRVSRDGAVLATVSGLSYADSGLSPATSYNYSVVALDAAGNASSATSASVATTSGGSNPGTAVRVNAGGPAYVDTAGNTWSADTGFNTGKASTEPGTANGTTDPALFKTVRFDESPSPELTYSFAVPNGSYSVRLLFAETAASGNGVGQRVFHVDLQGQRAFSDVDIFAQAGGSFKALTLTSTAAVNNGQLTVTFLHKINNPRVSAIEILPAP